MSKPDETYGNWARYNNYDGSMTLYRNSVFIAAIENTTASCRLFYIYAKEIETLQQENELLRKRLQYLINTELFVKEGINNRFWLEEPEESNKVGRIYSSPYEAIDAAIKESTIIGACLATKENPYD